MYPMAWYWQVQELERRAHPELLAAEQSANEALRAAHETWARTEQSSSDARAWWTFTLCSAWAAVTRMLKRAQTTSTKG